MSGIVGYSGSKSGIAGKAGIGQVVQVKHGDWAGTRSHGWIGNNHNDFTWGRHSSAMTFTNVGIGNKIMLWGAPTGYMGVNDYAVHYTWMVKDSANNEVDVSDLATASGGMGGNTQILAAFYNHEGAEDFGQHGGVKGYYVVQPTSGFSVECRLALKTGGGASNSNVWLEQYSFCIGFEVSQ